MGVRRVHHPGGILIFMMGFCSTAHSAFGVLLSQRRRRAVTSSVQHALFELTIGREHHAQRNASLVIGGFSIGCYPV
jgi:hypothetical protein